MTANPTKQDALEALKILESKAKAGAVMECPDERLHGAIEDKLQPYTQQIRDYINNTPPESEE